MTQKLQIPYSTAGIGLTCSDSKLGLTLSFDEEKVLTKDEFMALNDGQISNQYMEGWWNMLHNMYGLPEEVEK